MLKNYIAAKLRRLQASNDMKIPWIFMKGNKYIYFFIIL